MANYNNVATQCKCTVPIPIGYVPDSEYPDPTARLSGLLLQLTALTKERRRDGHFISFSDETWRRLFGGNASYIKRAAIRSGLIDVNDRYWVGGNGTDAFCKSVRLRAEHRTGEFRVYELSRKPRKQQKPQLDQSRLKQVGIDLTKHLSHFGLPSEIQPKSIWDVYKIDRIRHLDFYSMRCDFGRFRSSFTGLPKSTRFCLTTLSKEPLCFLDVKSAQPLIIGIQTRDKIRQGDGIPICHTLFRDDVDHWIERCEAGSIYDFVLEQIRADPVEPYWFTPTRKRRFLVDVSKWKEKQVKKAFIACLFDRVPSMQQNPVYPVIEQHFPTIARFMIESKASKYQALAHACQRMESAIMIDGVAAEFMRRFDELVIGLLADHE